MATIQGEIKAYMRNMGPEPEPHALIGLGDFMKCLNWYNYFYTNRDGIDFLLSYMRSEKFPTDEIDAVKSVPEWTIPFNIMSRARMLSRGFIFFEEDLARFHHQLREVITKAVARVAKERGEKVVKLPTYTAKDREMEQLGDVEEILDEFLEYGAHSFSAYDHFKKLGTNQAAVRRYSEKLKAIVDELNDPAVQKELAKPMEPKLKKAYVKFIEKIIKDCEAYSNTKKAERVVQRKPRKIKEKSADQLTKGVRYKKEDAEFKLTSLPPSSIIGAQQVWLFNTKYRNLQFYNATSDKGLSIKGVKIVDFVAEQNLKKLRKPESVLPEVLKNNKNGMKRVWAGIKMSEHKHLGRIDENTIILRVFR